MRGARCEVRGVKLRCAAAAAPEHSARRAGHGARRSLRAVVLVARDAGVRTHVGRHHLQHVELRRHLEQAAREKWVRVKLGYVTENVFVSEGRRV